MPGTGGEGIVTVKENSMLQNVGDRSCSLGRVRNSPKWNEIVAADIE